MQVLLQSGIGYKMWNNCTQVIDLDAQSHTLVVRDRDGNERSESYDALLNTSPIDQLVKTTGLTAPLRLARNKVKRENNESYGAVKNRFVSGQENRNVVGNGPFWP